MLMVVSDTETLSVCWARWLENGFGFTLNPKWLGVRGLGVDWCIADV